MSAHPVAPEDQERVRCQCGAPAVMCEHHRWSTSTREPTRSISFFYYCGACWVAPGPNQASPFERTGVAVPS